MGSDSAISTSNMNSNIESDRQRATDPPHTRSSRSLWTLYVKTAMVALVIIMASFFSFPQYRPQFLSEQGAVEVATAVLYLASVLRAGALAAYRQAPSAAMIGFGSLGLAIFLDEISFGEHLFSLPMPWIGGIKIDGIHDILELLVVVVFPQLVRSPSVIVAVALSVALMGTMVLGVKIAPRVLSYFERETLALCGAIALAGGISIVLDLDLLPLDFLFALEEAIELCAGLCMIFIVESCRRVHR